MNKTRTMILITLLVISAVVILLLILPINKNATNTKETHVLSTGQQLVMDSEYDITLLDTKTKEYVFGVKDIETNYRVNGESTLTIVERILPQEDLFLFFKWHDEAEHEERSRDRAVEFPKKIEFTLPVLGANKFGVNSFSALDIDRPHDNTVGVDETTYPNGLINFMKSEEHVQDVVLGKNYVSKKLVKQYEDESKSFIRQLFRERSSYTISQTETQSDLIFDMVFDDGYISEQWLLMSDHLLFEDKQELIDFIQISNEQYRRVNEWYTAEGVYSKLPWSVEPFAEEGYGRNLNYYKENTIIKLYRGNKERYYYNFLVNSLVNFENHEKNEANLLETHYTSTWLKKDYGTTAPYIDSRHNELGAIYINSLVEELGLSFSYDPMLAYANFLLEQEKLNNIIRISEDAYLIADYYDPSENAQLTHVSLNHVLGIMNLLLKVYLKTEDEAYLDVATKIHLALMETKEQWIREDGDLWYQINANFEFDGRDYPLVTLEDLIASENLWQTVRNSSDHLYGELISSKIGYLLSENVVISDRIKSELTKANYDLKQLRLD